MLSSGKSRSGLQFFHLPWLLEGGSNTLLSPGKRWLGLGLFPDHPLEASGASEALYGKR